MSILENAKRVLEADRFAVLSGIELVDAGEGYAVCRITIKDEHLNAADRVQGGAIFTLADTAFALAANSQGRITFSINSSISYFKSTDGTTLTATAKIITSSRRICNSEIEVKDELGELIAKMTVTGYTTSAPFPFAEIPPGREV